MNALTLLLYIAGIILGWVILYYLVKAAVRNGIKEASKKESTTIPTSHDRDFFSNSAQLLLQKRYDKGEITFEEYQTEWNKLYK